MEDTVAMIDSVLGRFRAERMWMMRVPWRNGGLAVRAIGGLKSRFLIVGQVPRRADVDDESAVESIFISG